MSEWTSDKIECLILIWASAAACWYVGYLMGQKGSRKR